MDRDKMCIFQRRPCIDASYQVSVHLVKWFQRKRILKICQSETRVDCGVMLVNGSERIEQSLNRTFHRCFLLSVSVHFAKWFQRRNNRPMRNKNCMFVNGSGRNEQSLERTFHTVKVLIFTASNFRGFSQLDKFAGTIFLRISYCAKAKKVLFGQLVYCLLADDVLY